MLLAVSSMLQRFREYSKIIIIIIIIIINALEKILLNFVGKL